MTSNLISLFLLFSFLLVQPTFATISNNDLQTLYFQTSNKLYTETIEKYNSLLPGNKLYFLEVALATSLYKTGKKKEAKELFTLLIKKQPYDGVINYYLGVLYYDEKEFQKSIPYFENAYLTKFQPFQTIYYLALIDYKNQKYHSAISRLIEIAEKSTLLRQQALFYIGLCNFHLRNESKTYLLDAQKSFTKSISIDQHSSYAKTATLILKTINHLIEENIYNLTKERALTLSLGLGREHNASRESTNSKNENIIKAAVTGFITPYSNNLFHLKTYYHNYTMLAVSTDPSYEESFKPTHLIRTAINYYPQDYIQTTLYIDYLNRKNYMTSNLTRIKVASDNTITLLNKFTSRLSLAYFNENFSSFPENFTNYRFEIYQNILFDDFIPFLKYQFTYTSNPQKAFNTNTDKFLVGLLIKQFIFNYSFIPSVSRSYIRSRSTLANKELLTFDEIYLSIENKLHDSLYLFAQGIYELYKYKNSHNNNFSAYSIGLGVKVRL